MNIYVGNLSQQATEEDLREAFGAFGDVKSVKIIKDKFSEVSRGFGFVEMEAKNEALAAIEELGSSELKGSRIIVNEARPKTDNRKSGGGRRW
jgi:RNA recognition motif-containing protein